MLAGAANRVACACGCRIRVHSFVLFVLSHGNWVKMFVDLLEEEYCVPYCTVLCVCHSVSFSLTQSFAHCLTLPHGSHCHTVHIATQRTAFIQNLHEWWKIANNISGVQQNYNVGPSSHSLIYDWSVRHQNRCFPIVLFWLVGNFFRSIFFFLVLIESVR